MRIINLRVDLSVVDVGVVASLPTVKRRICRVVHCIDVVKCCWPSLLE